MALDNEQNTDESANPLNPAWVLQSIQNRNASTPLSINDVNNMSFGMSPQEQDAFDAMYANNKGSTGALPFNAYYPGYNPPQQTSYSGSIVGNIPIFPVGGGLVPIGMMDARDTAIQNAALKKAKMVQDFKDQYYKNAPTSKLTNINDSLTQEYFNHLKTSWSKAMKANGNNAAQATYALENNPDFQAKTKSFHDLAKYGDDIVATKARLDDERKTGKFVPSERLKQTENLLFNALKDPSSPDFKNVGNYYRQFKQDEDFSKNLNEMAKDVFKQENGNAWVDTKDPDFIKTYETTEKKFTPESIQYMKDNLHRIYDGSEQFTPEYIDREVDNFAKAVQKTTKLNVQQKREADGKDMKINWNERATEPKQHNVKSFAYTGSGGTPVTKESSVTGYDAVTFPEKMFKEQAVPNGTQIYDAETGRPDNTTGARNVKWTEMVNMPWMGNVLITDDMMKNGFVTKYNPETKTTEQVKIDPSLIVYKPTLTGAEKVPVRNDQGIIVKENYKNIYTDAEQFRNQIVGKVDANGKTLTGAPLNEQLEAAKKRTEEFHKNAAPAPQPKKLEIKESDIPAKAKAAGYSVSEYKKLLTEKGVTIK